MLLGLEEQVTTASELRERFLQANQAYHQEHFEEAQRLYMEILDQIPRNPTVEYNLANTYARLGDIGRAVLHYERALRTWPDDPETRANLELLAPAPHAEPSPLLWPFQWLKRQMNINQWLWMTFGFWLALCVSGSLWALDRARTRLWRFSTVLLTFVFLIGVVFSTCWVLGCSRKAGVMLPEETFARSGPGPKYLESVKLPAGTKVWKIGPPTKGWIRVRTQEGLGAYVQIQDIGWI